MEVPMGPLESLARSWFEVVWGKQDFAAARRLASADCRFIDHGVGAPGEIGLAELEQRSRTLVRAIPDLHFEVEDAIEAGDQVALRMTVSGTHRGEGLGIPPTGNAIRIAGVTIGRYRDGLLVEGRNFFDLLSLYEQVGAVRRPS
jgi:steroid delta-isomerase-like uncharacterized protein